MDEKGEFDAQMGYWQHKQSADELEEAQQNFSQANNLSDKARAKNKLNQAQAKYNDRLVSAQDHKEEHLDEYIETAKQEAQADGKVILDPPA